MEKARSGRPGRRHFLKQAAAIAAVASPTVAKGQDAPDVAAAPPRPGAPSPTAKQLDADIRPGAAKSPSWIIEHPGADFMVDTLKAMNFEFVAANPGTSFGGIHESLLNYGGNARPEFLTCCHEESAVAMAHGYAKIEGRPMLTLLHGTVGLQHASMAIFNAYADRVPIFMIVGNWGNAIQAHNAQDMALMVRDSIKWDDEPKSLSAFAESAMKAYRIAMTPPMGPVLLVID